MARLDLTDKEQLAMLYVLVKQVSQEDLSNLTPRSGCRTPPSFAAFANLVSKVPLVQHLDILLCIMQVWLHLACPSEMASPLA